MSSVEEEKQLTPTGEKRNQMRIYLIASNRGVRLVRAAHRAQALSFVASQELNVRVASQEDLVKHLAEGKPIETVAAPDQVKLDLA